MGASRERHALPMVNSFLVSTPPHHFGGLCWDWTWVSLQADTEVGKKVMIACNVAFLNSDDHRFDQVGKAMWDSGRGDKFKIILEDDVWIGHGVILLSPVRVGRGAIVAAGSIVVKDVLPYAIVGGNPAKVLKMRFTPEQIKKHEQTLYPDGVDSLHPINNSLNTLYSQ